jgi:hypothetical protein
MGVPNQLQHDQADERGGDLLVGADAILNYLVFLGMPEDTDVYYLRRVARWPIGKTTAGGGGSLIASKRRLNRYADAITRGPDQQEELTE